MNFEFAVVQPLRELRQGFVCMRAVRRSLLGMPAALIMLVAERLLLRFTAIFRHMEMTGLENVMPSV